MSWNIQFSGHKDYHDEIKHRDDLAKVKEIAKEVTKKLQAADVGIGYAYVSDSFHSADLLKESE